MGRVGRPGRKALENVVGRNNLEYLQMPLSALSPIMVCQLVISVFCSGVARVMAACGTEHKIFATFSLLRAHVLL